MPAKTLHDLGEWALIRRLTRLLPSGENVHVGIGDDVAVVGVDGSPSDLLLTSDAAIEGTHFLSSTPPEKIGHKAVGRVLSDFAAVGGEPLWALIDVAAPPRTSAARVERAYRGAAKLADKYGLAVVGGDTTTGPVLEFHVFGVGRVPHGSAILRSGARAGDAIYVTGSLGGSLAGRHLAFEPRVAEGLWLREEGWANSMIDISDGLASDLLHIVEMSGVGAELLAEQIPVSPSARRARDGRGALDHALNDGEDFELLFTVSAGKQAAFESSWRDTFDLPCSRIGRMTGKRGRVVLVDARGRRTVLKNAGFEHFARP